MCAFVQVNCSLFLLLFFMDIPFFSCYFFLSFRNVLLLFCSSVIFYFFFLFMSFVVSFSFSFSSSLFLSPRCKPSIVPAVVFVILRPFARLVGLLLAECIFVGLTSGSRLSLSLSLSFYHVPWTEIASQLSGSFEINKPNRTEPATEEAVKPFPSELLASTLTDTQQ